MEIFLQVVSVEHVGVAPRLSLGRASSSHRRQSRRHRFRRVGRRAGVLQVDVRPHRVSHPLGAAEEAAEAESVQK